MGIAARLKAFNLQGWIEANRHRLQPPVGNQLLFEDAGMIVMAIGGPNQRTDFQDRKSTRLNSSHSSVSRMPSSA